jgi:GNAT superfamily N-acetyltransferase
MAERAVLDRRSDALARSFLEPLSDPQRERLASAMTEVERLLTAALVEIGVIDPAHRHAQHCLHEYYTELNRRFDSGFDPAVTRSVDLDEVRAPAGLFLVAALRSEPIGCGALKFHSGEPAEIKRMWVAESARGLGVGRRLLAELEARATAAGCRAVRLDTNKALTEAIAMYHSAGYVEVDAFNDEPYADHWFEKRLY